MNGCWGADSPIDVKTIFAACRRISVAVQWLDALGSGYTVGIVFCWV